MAERCRLPGRGSRVRLATDDAPSGRAGDEVAVEDISRRHEILTVSLWESEDAIRAFAGDDIRRAVFYPEDDAWLTSRDLQADHWQVAGEVVDLAPTPRG